MLELISARLASIWPRATLVVDATVRSKILHAQHADSQGGASHPPYTRMMLFDNDAVTTKDLRKLVLQLLLHVDPKWQANR